MHVCRGLLTWYSHCKVMRVLCNHPLFELIDPRSKRTFSDTGIYPQSERKIKYAVKTLQFVF